MSELHSIDPGFNGKLTALEAKYGKFYISPEAEIEALDTVTIADLMVMAHLFLRLKYKALNDLEREFGVQSVWVQDSDPTEAEMLHVHGGKLGGR